MATRKSREVKTGSRPKQRKSKVTDECLFPGQQERLPLHIPGAYEVAMGTGEEVAAWLQGASGNSHAILISFSDEASFRVYGPIYWHVVRKLPETVSRIQRHRLEQLVDALTQL
jgi:hypothetical protein